MRYFSYSRIPLCSRFCSRPLNRSCVNKYLSSTTTYYDSQSGLHIPVHNEKEIRLFLDVHSSYDTFVPHQLYKNRDEANEMSDKLNRLVQVGIHGVIFPVLKFPRDLRNLQTLSVIAPPNFFFICSSGKTTSSIDNNDHDGILKAKGYSSSTNFSKIFRYDNSKKDGDGIKLQSSFKKSVENGNHTTLMLTEDIYGSDNNCDVEPITLANNIASMVDTEGGCDFIWISSKTKDNVDNTIKDPSTDVLFGADTIIQICEELLYLDVAGATIKSRLMLNPSHEDVLEDSMFAGVNKYVIDSEDQIEMVEDAAKNQGKSLVR